MLCWYTLVLVVKVVRSTATRCVPSATKDLATRGDSAEWRHMALLVTEGGFTTAIRWMAVLCFSFCRSSDHRDRSLFGRYKLAKNAAGVGRRQPDRAISLIACLSLAKM
ncbi:hypothetical protein GGS20DRAFT_535461 [Poronia punctata]|nr:hypothetical protein GGS20DRAFT_535461 [Poronia punctata]